MMYINSFITELSKKIETVEMQLNDFESKMNEISEVKNMLALRTLKDVGSLTGEDLVLLTKEEFAQILNVFKFDEQLEKIKIFFNASVAIKVNQKLLSDGEIVVNEDTTKLNNYKKWLDEQVRYIKEYLNDFNENNKEYYNSLKVSDSLYKKYLNYFKNNKLIKPIYNIEEFNEVIKKSGIITSEKWQLLKYVGEKNIEFQKNNESNKKEVIEYTEDEIISFVEEIIKNEEALIKGITDEVLDFSLKMLDFTDKEIKNMNITADDVIKYQKIPILDSMNKMYIETKELLKEDLDKDAIHIEKNMKSLLELVQSYDIMKKIES